MLGDVNKSVTKSKDKIRSWTDWRSGYRNDDEIMASWSRQEAVKGTRY